ncbi:hypothetical protein ACFE04_022817 [Oxalis oulophora]
MAVCGDADYDGTHQQQQYSFAVEYDGPPLLSYNDLPRAVPVNVDDIPLAAIVNEGAVVVNKLPIVQPIVYSDPTTIANKGFDDPVVVSVSPTSVIAFEEETRNHGDELSSYATSVSGELLVNNNADNCSISCVLPLVSNDLVNENENENEDENEDVSCGSTIECYNSFDKSIEGSSGLLGKDESLDSNELARLDSISNESILSLDYYPSSRVSSSRPRESNCNAIDEKKPHNVTFLDEFFDNEELSQDESPIIRAKKEPQSKGKKGSCYRCFKGSRFTDKEICIVCDAKYCVNCVLRAMGSMPEGRKCVGCIGFSIDESKRGNLGKCSRMLKRLLNELEVRQIMKAEKICEANQLPSEYIRVNGKPLCNEELVMLQTCGNPPKQLKPGNYWYDKVSGLWGKEGQKPSRIISPHLNVGGPIRTDASNGNTQIYINGREITKVELRMLQLAGVQCAGNPHFWVNEDGSYQEEGQKNTKGYIWGKAGTKLLCAVLSLPVLSKSSSALGGEQVSSLNRVVPDYLEQRALQKLLLVGYSGSGTSTIFKQAKILYKASPFSEDERENIKMTIQSNVYGYLGILLEGRERFEDEGVTECTYSIGPRFKAFSDWLLKTMVSGNLEAIFPAATREYAPLVEELWKDVAIQATYKRRSELEMLPSVASYFLERAVDILKADYEPSDLDILYAEHVISSNGLASVEFSFPQSGDDDGMDTVDLHDLLSYQLIRVQARGIGENCKWLEMFEDIGMVIFCVSLSDYDQYTVDLNGSSTNKMLLSQQFFETIVTNPTFEQTNFLLLLNKCDLFEEKVERVPLSVCDWFDDFHPLVSRSRNHNPTLGQLGFHHVALKFKRLYASLTGRKLYVSAVKGLDPTSVDTALKYAKEILKWDEERQNFNASEYSFYSTDGDASSISN